MQPETVLQVVARSEFPIVHGERHPDSPELGADLAQLELQQRITIDRKRHEELARLRAVQSFD